MTNKTMTLAEHAKALAEENRHLKDKVSHLELSLKVADAALAAQEKFRADLMANTEALNDDTI